MVNMTQQNMRVMRATEMRSMGRKQIMEPKANPRVDLMAANRLADRTAPTALANPKQAALMAAVVAKSQQPSRPMEAAPTRKPQPRNQAIKA